MELVSQNRSFGGWHKRYKHSSLTTHCDMTFAIYLPPQADTQAVPVLYWLSGLTCTDENFMQKANAQRIAANLGLAIVCPDTSPRGEHVYDHPDDDNIGSGAGFYLNATQPPWDQHYQMYDYIVDELPVLIKQHFPVTDKWSISGHSMGGHGAITIALKNPERYCSVSAFAPICHPTGVEKSRQRLQQYLGDDEAAWEQYDASVLVAQFSGKSSSEKLPLLVDQGLMDEMIDGLSPEVLKTACDKADYPLNLRFHKGYNHGYYFVASFIEEHLHYHAKALGVLGE